MSSRSKQGSLQVALATSAEFPQLAPEDRTLLHALEARGIAAGARGWSDAEAWADPPSVVVIRSCWDYPQRLSEFLAWIGRLEERGIRVLNPPRLLRWNTRKRYLLDLEAAGLPIGIPTALIQRNDQLAPDEQFSWSDIVVKPEVSGRAWETYRLHPLDSSADLARLREIVAARSCIIQPFVPDIMSHGELALVFFRGVFSHGVLKETASGEYRVQEEYGGTARRVSPDRRLVDFATEALGLSAVLTGVQPQEIAYARIDVVNALPARLMEVEVIEPSLFLELCAGAAEVFAEAIEEAHRAE